MTQEDRVDEQLADDDVAADSEEDSEELGEDEAIDTSDFEAAVDDLDDADEEFDLQEDELTQKEQNARSLAARRAIEQRMEQKRLEDDLDYLDLDLDE